MSATAWSVVLVAVVAGAGPTPPSDGPGWSDDFDSYAPGTPLSGVGGWLPTIGAPLVDSALASSTPNSVLAHAESVAVRPFSIHSGGWRLRVNTFMPGAVGGGDGWVLMYNEYIPQPFAANWSLQVRFDWGTVHSYFSGHTTALLPDQWAELRADIDLEHDRLDLWYGGVLFAPNLVWSENGSGGGVTSIAALELYGGEAGFRWDNTSLVPVDLCYADCDRSGALTVADFVCYQTAFVEARPYADCNTDGQFTVADFTCFQAGFVAGCP